MLYRVVSILLLACSTHADNIRPLSPVEPSINYKTDTIRIDIDVSCVNSKTRRKGVDRSSSLDTITTRIFSTFPCLDKASTPRIFGSSMEKQVYSMYVNLTPSSRKNRKTITNAMAELRNQYANHNENEDCLFSDNIDWTDNCISQVQYEKVFDADQFSDAECVPRDTDGLPRLNSGGNPSGTFSLWGLDIVDGENDGIYEGITDSEDPGVDVYVLDEAVLASHAVFKDSLPWDTSGPPQVVVVSDPDAITTPGNHGTHVAGTIGGTTVGVTKDMRIYSFGVCDDDGCPDHNIMAGLDWVYDHVVNTSPRRRGVINMSLGSFCGSNCDFDPAYTSRFEALAEEGVITVVAAGNEGESACESDFARYPHTLAVGAVSSNLAATDFTNFGDCVDIYAPGDGIWSSVASGSSHYIQANGGLGRVATMSGTSMASPMVAGLVAQLLALNPTWDEDDVLDELRFNALPVSSCPTETSLSNAGCVVAVLECDVTDEPTNAASEIDEPALSTEESN